MENPDDLKVGKTGETETGIRMERNNRDDTESVGRNNKRNYDSQGSHEREHSQPKSKPPLRLCLSAKAGLNKGADADGAKL